MRTLDWKNTAVQVTTTTHPQWQTAVIIGAIAKDLQVLHSELGQAVAANTELRLELPSKWTIYFKLRVGASRISLAHPQIDQWVASLNLAPAHAQLVLDQILSVITVGGIMSINHLGSPGPFANVDVSFSRI